MAWLEANGYRNRIQRKSPRNKPLSPTQQGRNGRIAKTRARVEPMFASIAQMGGKLIRTMGQARANFAMTMMAACHNLERRVYCPRVGIVPASRPKWAQWALSTAIRGKNWAKSLRKAAICRGICAGSGQGHRSVARFIENCGLFEVAVSLDGAALLHGGQVTGNNQMATISLGLVRLEVFRGARRNNA